MKNARTLSIALACLVATSAATFADDRADGQLASLTSQLPRHTTQLDQHVAHHYQDEREDRARRDVFQLDSAVRWLERQVSLYGDDSVRTEADFKEVQKRAQAMRRSMRDLKVDRHFREHARSVTRLIGELSEAYGLDVKDREARAEQRGWDDRDDRRASGRDGRHHSDDRRADRDDRESRSSGRGRWADDRDRYDRDEYDRDDRTADRRERANRDASDRSAHDRNDRDASDRSARDRADWDEGSQVRVGWTDNEARRGSERRPTFIPRGAPIAVTLEHPVRARDYRPGESISVRVAEDVVVDAHVLVPAGTAATMRVREIQEAGRVKGLEQITFELTALDFDGKGVQLDSNMVTYIAEKSTERDAKVIGGSAALGTIIGIIKEGGKGAAKGAAVGAVAGTAVVLTTRGATVKLPAGQRIEFSLEEPADVLHVLSGSGAS